MSGRRTASTTLLPAGAGEAQGDERATSPSFEPLTQREIARRIRRVADGLAQDAPDGRDPWPIAPRELVLRLQKLVVLN